MMPAASGPAMSDACIGKPSCQTFYAAMEYADRLNRLHCVVELTLRHRRRTASHSADAAAGLRRRPKSQPASAPMTTPPPPTYQRSRVSSAIRVLVKTFDDRCKLTIFHSPPDFAAVALHRELSLNGPRIMGKNSSSMLPSARATSPPEPTKRAWAPSLARVVYLLMMRPWSFTMRR